MVLQELNVSKSEPFQAKHASLHDQLHVGYTCEFIVLNCCKKRKEKKNAARC